MRDDHVSLQWLCTVRILLGILLKGTDTNLGMLC